MNILYIDDDASNRMVLREMLASAGIHLAEAADARTGLSMIDEQDYVLILMDLRMPEISGLTAIRQLRARAGSKGQVPVVIVTADLTAGVQGLCRDAGANSFLAKPVNMTSLYDVIGSVMAEAGTVVVA